MIHSRHTVEEDLWEISGLPQPKSGPGGGCPTVAGFNGNAVLDQTRCVNTDGTIGCYTQTPYPLATFARARYRRYGVYFQLFIRAEERRTTQNNAHTCNDLRIEVHEYTYRVNGSSVNIPISSESKNYTGINQDYRKLVLYGGPKRLCNFYLTGLSGSRKVWGGTSWTFTPQVTIFFNYTP